MEVELNSRIVSEHPEADGVLAADGFLFRIDADVEMIEEEIIVSAIAAILAPQDVGARGA